MRVALVVALMVLAGCPPLRPGQTRCQTREVFGVMQTDCETGQEEPPPRPYVPPPPAVFWCTTRPVDGFGVCASQPGWCENARTAESSACYYQAYAVCAVTGCFTTPAACALFERHAGRNANGCVLRR